MTKRILKHKERPIYLCELVGFGIAYGNNKDMLTFSEMKPKRFFELTKTDRKDYE